MKRGKRRLDYERHLGMKAANKKIDDKTMAQVREYEALNETLKFELPKLAALTERIGKVCMERFVFIQSDWWGTLQAKIKAVSDANHVSTELDIIVEHFRRDFRYPEARLSELSITKEEFLQSIGTGRLSQSTTATREDDASIHSRTRNGTMSATSRSRGISLNSDHTPNLSAHESQIRFSDGLTQNPETTSNRRLTVEYPPIGRENWLISPTTAAIESALKGYSPRQSSERSHDPETPWRSVNASDAINIPTRKSSVPQPLSLDVPDTYIQKLRSRYPIEMYENPESPGYSPIDGEPPEGYKVLYLAASLFEFNFSGDKRVGDLRYLTYQAGEVSSFTPKTRSCS
jgi:dynamin-binding protein